MKRRIWIIGSLECLLSIALAASGLGAQAPAAQVDAERARIVADFTARVEQYAKLRKDVEASLTSLKPTRRPAKISDHQHALARKLATARHGAEQGDIFTKEATRLFRRILNEEFQGPDAQRALKTIRPDEDSKATGRIHVNQIYPEDAEVRNMPPTLLAKLPPLPPDLTYRVFGRDLTLKDTKSGLIVDLIPNAIP